MAERTRGQERFLFARGRSSRRLRVMGGAQAYAAWLSRTTLRAYHLPTEAEWEYAARAGSNTAYYFGEDPRGLCDHANGADQITAFQWGNLTCSDGVGVQTARVGRYQPNGFGLYDVLGNVSEWVQDCVNETYASAPSDGMDHRRLQSSRHPRRRMGQWTKGPAHGGPRSRQQTGEGYCRVPRRMIA